MRNKVSLIAAGHRRVISGLLRCHLIIAVLLLPAAAQAEGIDTSARQAILMDYDTGTVLFEKNAHERMAPSSMSKLMTLNMLFEELKDGRVKLTDRFPVSEHAWRTGGAATDGSTMFAALGSSIPVEDLIRGVAVQSGNDAAIVIAEGLGGTEAEFAQMMNRWAKELGLNESHFMNATGLPDPDHYMTAHDLAVLARHLIKDLGQYYHYFSETEFMWNKVKQQNRDPLLYLGMGADGLKTGHTRVGGFGLTSSAIRKGQRFIVVVNGLQTVKARSSEPRRLLEYAFREFKSYELFAANAKVDSAEVWRGQIDSVPLVTAEPVRVGMLRSARPKMRVSVRYEAPIAAPIEKGQRIGTLEVVIPGTEKTTFPLLAGKSIERAGVVGDLLDTALYLIDRQFAEKEASLP